MTGFRFWLAELKQETIALDKIATPFIDRKSSLVLGDYLQDLQNISEQPVGTDHRLSLKPLWTIPSTGQYEAGARRKGKPILAKIEGAWQLRVHPSNQSPLMEFCGIASTKVVIFGSNDPCTPIAKWQLDLGDHRSPGCYIHSQIPWGFDSETPVQKSIPIPRLPSIFVTPMSAIEFVLGELFQDEWPERTNRLRGETTIWSRLQKKWLQGLFSWYLDVLKDGEEKEDGIRRKSRVDRGNENDKRKKKSSHSPWMTLKSAKPNGGLFVEDQ